MWFIKRPKTICLALSSGAARGLAHIGVIECLIEHSFQISAIGGSSIGSIVGAYYCLRKSISGLKKIALETDWKMLLGLLDLNLINLSQGGLIQGRKIERFLKELFGDATFNDCKIPLIIIATDLYTGEPVEICEGKIWHAVRASISIPGIFIPIKHQGRILIDGGVSCPLAVESLKKRHYKNIWAVNVLSRPPQLQKRANQINIIDNLTQSLFIMESAIANQQAQECKLCISPPVADHPFYDFTLAEKLINIGYITTEKILSQT